jgi:hypothetical protein
VFLGYYFSVLLRLPPSLLLCFFSAPRRYRSTGHVLRPRCPFAALGRATCRPRTAPPPSPSRAVFSPPCHAAWPSARVAPRRCSPSLEPDRRHLLLPAVPRVLPRPPVTFPTPCWPAPASPTSHRHCPCRHTLCRHASSCFRTATSSFGP